MSELQILFPAMVVADVNGRAVGIKPVQLRHFEVFGKASAELMAALASPAPGAVLLYASKNKNLRAILGRATTLTAWQIWRLPAAVAVELMVHVVRVNASFFDQALIGLAEVLAGQASRNN